MASIENDTIDAMDTQETTVNVPSSTPVSIPKNIHELLQEVNTVRSTGKPPIAALISVIKKYKFWPALQVKKFFDNENGRAACRDAREKNRAAKLKEFNFFFDINFFIHLLFLIHFFFLVKKIFLVKIFFFIQIFFFIKNKKMKNFINFIFFYNFIFFLFFLFFIFFIFFFYKKKNKKIKK